MKLFLLFHLNLSFSSIKESQKKDIIAKCYWPILEIASKNNIPISLEISASSLVEIEKLNIFFIKELKKLIKKKLINIVESGYVQLIGPLNKKDINLFNLKKGKEIYKKILKTNSEIALINEQSFSKGLINSYKQMGYEKIVMECNNLFSSNKNWKSSLTKSNQFLVDDNNNKIEVIWTDTNTFQYFQRYVHGKINFKGYLDFLKNYPKKDYFPIYSNDTEIFNYRPGRFKEEGKITNDEWYKIEKILKTLQEKYSFISLNKIFNNNKKILKHKNPGNMCPVKKQNKYNLSRWAVTGRNDIWLNTFAENYFDYLLFTNQLEKNFKNALDFFKSDYRTHIDKDRWDHIKIKIKKILTDRKFNKFIKNDIKKFSNNCLKLKFKIFSKLKKLEFKINKKLFIFNELNGLSINSVVHQNKDFLGTIPQGFYQNIELLQDYFSGHTLIVSKKYGKMTDLNSNNFKSGFNDNFFFLSNSFKTNNYNFIKKYFINKKSSELLIYSKLTNSRINDIKIYRPYHFTFKLKSSDEVKIATNNGGNIETFKLSDSHNSFDNCLQANELLSNNNISGMSENMIKIIINNTEIIFSNCSRLSKLYPMLQYKKLNNQIFFRLIFTCKEYDDTTLNNELKNIVSLIKIKIK